MSLGSTTVQSLVANSSDRWLFVLKSATRWCHMNSLTMNQNKRQDPAVKNARSENTFPWFVNLALLLTFQRHPWP